MGTNEPYFSSKFLQENDIFISLFSVEIGIIQLRAPKLKMCPKQPRLLYFQNKTRNFLQTELPIDEFLGTMGSKFEYTYFKKICSPRSLVYSEI